MESRAVAYTIRVTFKSPGAKWLYYFPLVAPFVILTSCLIVVDSGPVRRLEYFILDRMIRMRSKTDDKADPRLFFVGIDDRTLVQLGRWPFARVFHGEFVAFLSMMKPGALCWDILFTEEDEINDDAFVQGIEMFEAPMITGAACADPNTALLAESANFGKTKPLPNVEYGDSVPDHEWVLVPVEVLRKISTFGFVDSPAELDGMRRHIPLVLKVNNRFYPNLALQALMQFWNLEPNEVRVVPGDAVYLDGKEIRRRIPIDERGRYLLNFRYEKEDFDGAGYGALHQSLAAHYNGIPVANLPDLTGKLIFIALSATGTSEIGPSPLNAESLIPLVHLNTLDNILREDYLKVGDRRIIWVAWLIVALATSIIVGRLSFWAGITIVGAIVVAAPTVMWLSFAGGNLWLPLGLPLLGFAGLHVADTGLHLLEEQLARRKMRQAFSPYFAPKVLEHVIDNPDELTLGGIRKPVTVLFSDIRSFTSLSESVGEERLVSQLNEYFSEMAECVANYHGTLLKFIGDAIMAAWGDVMSETVEEDARQSLRSALAMRAGLSKLNTHWRERGMHELRIGIGLNHGPALVGNIGAPRRMEFTVMGDSVNVASRIEGLSKYWHTDIAVGESVSKLAGNRFLCHTLGLFRLVGKAAPVRVYSLVRELAAGEAIPEEYLRYEEAFQDYLSGHFESAGRGFEEFLHTHPDDFPAEYYSELCRQFMVTPPPQPWNGVYISTSK